MEVANSSRIADNFVSVCLIRGKLFGAFIILYSKQLPALYFKAVFNMVSYKQKAVFNIIA